MLLHRHLITHVKKTLDYLWEEIIFYDIIRRLMQFKSA